MCVLSAKGQNAPLVQSTEGYRPIASTTARGVNAANSEQQDAERSGARSLEGSVTFVKNSDMLNGTFGDLTRSALQQDRNYLAAEKAVAHYQTKVQRSVRFAKDALNYAVPYRGCSMSIEGSRLLLDKHGKLNNLCIAELAQQRYWDEMRPRVIAHVLQIAMGLGLSDPKESQYTIELGMRKLEDLVGHDEAERTLAALKEWNGQLQIDESAYDQPLWDVDTSDQTYRDATEIAEHGDPLIVDLSQKIKKFDHGKLFNLSASAIESNLAVATMLSTVPMISVGAEALNTSYVMAIGGPEENKILKEVYFGRRLEIRRKRISDELQLALNNYQKALLTHNGPLLAASESVLGQLVGPDAVEKVLGRPPAVAVDYIPPIQLGGKSG